METITVDVLRTQTVKKARVKNKRVILRVDWNVPMKKGRITNESRILASLQTINYLLLKDAKQIICISHLGRPKGIDTSFSLLKVANRVEKLLKRKVTFLKSCDYSDFEKLSKKDQLSKILILENLRFEPDEKKNSVSFARKLAKFGDIYVNDAFGVSHRSHSSTVAITKILPSYIGLLVKTELLMIQKIRENPKRPLVTMIGFAKISDKIAILKRLLTLSDTILIGGAVAFTFLEAKGIKTGKSMVEKDMIPIAKKFLDQFGKKIILPLDAVCARSLDSKKYKVYNIEHIPKSYAGYDIGPKTILSFLLKSHTAKSFFWNGPVGVYEVKPYHTATQFITKELAELSQIQVIIGGGDTVSAISQSISRIPANYFLSTGGGASICALKSKPLPAIRAIYMSKRR